MQRSILLWPCLLPRFLYTASLSLIGSKAAMAIKRLALNILAADFYIIFVDFKSHR